MGDEETIIVVSLSDGELPSLKVFPNPTAGQLNIQFSSEDLPELIQIRDLQGRLILSESVNSRGAFSIYLGHLDAGSYIIECSDGKSILYSSKVIVQQ